MNRSGLIISLTECTRDIRISKTAIYLSGIPVDITVLSCHNDTSFPEKADLGYAKILRLPPLGNLFHRLFHRTKENNVASSSDSVRHGLSHEFFGLVNVVFFFLVQVRIFLAIISYKFDFCHTNDWDCLFAGYLYSRFRKTVWIHDSHELYAEQDPDFPRSFKKIVRYTESIFFRRVNHLITVNNSIAQYFSAEYGILSPGIIYNCPVSEDIPPPPSHEGPVTFIYVGLYEKNRGLEELIECFSSVEGLLYFQGFGTREEWLRNRVQELGLEKKVVFIAPVPGSQIVSSISGFDIGLLPYKPVCLNNYYASPNKLFEYMMAGLAIVSVDIPEVRRIVHEWKNGVLYDPSDVGDFIEKVRHLAENPDLVASMKKNSLSSAQKEYHWEKQAEILREIYR